jgi:hypothetical protein
MEPKYSEYSLAEFEDSLKILDQESYPHCNSFFGTTLKLKVFVIALILMFVIHLFLLKPLVELFGLNGTVSVGIIGGILSILVMRYRKVRRSNVT